MITFEKPADIRVGAKLHRAPEWGALKGASTAAVRGTPSEDLFAANEEEEVVAAVVVVVVVLLVAAAAPVAVTPLWCQTEWHEYII